MHAPPRAPEVPAWPGRNHGQFISAGIDHKLARTQRHAEAHLPPRITPSASSKELQVLAQGTRYASPASAPTLRRSPTSPLVPVTPGMFDDTSGLAPVTATT